MDILRRAVAREHPLHLLSIASLFINVGKPDPHGRERYLDDVLTSWIGARDPAVTAVLAVLAELLVDEPAAQLRCREEVAARNHVLPQWITDLPEAEAYRAVRRRHVLADADELVLGVQFGRHELTVAVFIDHLGCSSIADGGAVPKPIDDVLARVAESSTDPEAIEMSLADARAWIEDAFTKPAFAPETDSWPLYRALVQWLVARLPEGGECRPGVDWDAIEELCDTFFATRSAAPFTERSHQELLLELLETGSGDALRWSAARVHQAIGGAFYDGNIPLAVALDAPDLLRAFIPYAHAQSGIRDELTARTLAAIDDLRLSYKEEVLEEAAHWGYLDAG
ncbi:hypothetical protein MMAG44476_34841 [Mycolicibacterium mageritense DSM 44476 = CIP 104973]|uniref:Uncharacterized protein n=2 Tax=Mycolicibacterium mageritense TaxID=53462 RepID=A0ABN5YAQ4_MYCME|nr:hypothetical protein MMAGJ_41480 [Mycolicibacterium mageritense]